MLLIFYELLGHNRFVCAPHVRAPILIVLFNI